MFPVSHLVRKKRDLSIRSILPALVLAAASLPLPAFAAPALWQVRDADSAVWLFGSVHLLQPDTEWRTSLFDKVMAKADRVYFETDVGVEAQMRIAPLAMELGFNRDGRLLSETIGPELTGQLREVARATGTEMPLLLTMRPWMAATTISLSELTSRGYDPVLGVETVLAAELPEGRVGFLETPEEQMYFIGGGSPEEGISMLQATLDTIDTMPEDIAAMVAAWVDGTPEEMGDIFISQLGGYDEALTTRLIDERNRNWVELIDTMLAENEQALIVVGAGHLVGEISVVRLLEERGHVSRRLQ